MYRFISEIERQEELRLISECYESNRGLDNFIELDIDDEIVNQFPKIDCDEDLKTVRNSVKTLILEEKTKNILFVINMYRTIGDKVFKCIAVHMCNPEEESMYLAKCKKQGSRKFLGKFEKVDFKNKTHGLFGDLFTIHREIHSHKEAI
jgi:hypothetical protein